MSNFPFSTKYSRPHHLLCSPPCGCLSACQLMYTKDKFKAITLFSVFVLTEPLGWYPIYSVKINSKLKFCLGFTEPYSFVSPVYKVDLCGFEKVYLMTRYFVIEIIDNWVQKKFCTTFFFNFEPNTSEINFYNICEAAFDRKKNQKTTKIKFS